MEAQITSDLFWSVIHPHDLYFYVAELSNLSTVSVFGSLEKIIGNHSIKDLKHPIEFNKSIVHPDDRPLVSDCTQKFSDGTGRLWSGFYRIKHAGGGWVWIHSRLYAINENGSPTTKVAGMIMDISSCIKTETQLATIFREAARFQYAEKIKQLTPRELVIIKFIAEGHCYKDIASQLFIQPDTVNKHRKNILHKLGLKNIAMLACFAKETGLV
jgi:DNA-binding CsgD family transcriptional regulator